jgi:alpha-amylase/alpha-mannosidase (GH57 family)
MSQPRYVCIHGHFYQPPRENPWLEAVEVQDSAAPYHDWNERITRECYGPNCRARLVDHHGKIIDLINNYAWMSFNFGPTLLSWLQEAAPDVLQGILEGDRLSKMRRRGHGNALAQIYNHVILPLASERDKQTQVLWGLADFRRRFGREPEGMWLPETAVDLASLETLAAAGIRFTVLAPRQAKRWRKIGDVAWTEIPEGVDPSRAYLCHLPSGATMALFFYDGHISRQVAFEGLLDSGEKFLGQILNGFDDTREHAQLVHLATDGESYGHHHPHGDMALAYVLSQLSRHDKVRLTNYGEFLERHPPEWEVEIHENSSWSCAHGIERWRSDCGCNSGRGWQQAWRGPLRDSFDALRLRLDHLFETHGKWLFPDPWAARNAYIDVILDRSEDSLRRFLHGYGRPKPELSAHETHEAFWLLEMQRNGLLMYTSCGWFFDEISGLETTQCLRYAARAMQLAQQFEMDCEEELAHLLEKAPSNLLSFKHGRGVWEQMIRPAKIDLERVLAHYAISLIYRTPETHSRVYSFDVEAIDQEVRSRGESHVAIGRLKVRSRLTWHEAETSFVVLHYGGLDFHAVLRNRAQTVEKYAAFKKKLLKLYTTGSMADVTAMVMKEFEGEAYRLDDLFVEERRRIIGIVLQDRFTEYHRVFERLAEQDANILQTTGRLNYPIPRTLRLVAATALDQRLRQAIAGLNGISSLARIKDLLEAGRPWGYQPEEREELGKILGEELRKLIAAIDSHSDLPQVTRHADHLLDAAALLGMPLDLWQTQNHLLAAFAKLAGEHPVGKPLRHAFAHLADRLNLNPHVLGWRP